MNLDSIPAPRERRKKGQAAPGAMGHCALYLRVSTEDQSSSLESQEDACRAEAGRRGLAVAAIYRDDGWSGGSIERPALTELRAAVQAGEVAACIVYALDRLSRRQTDTLALLDEFAAAGAGLISASQSFETHTPLGRAMIGMLAIFAEIQREDIRARTRQALARKREAGQAVGRAAYGLRIAVCGDQKQFVPDPATWPQLSEILALRGSGRSCQWIADRLNRRGVATPSGRGRWSAATVAALCRSRAVREVAERG
jgi:site-specific DNA recombinase